MRRWRRPGTVDGRVPALIIIAASLLGHPAGAPAPPRDSHTLAQADTSAAASAAARMQIPFVENRGQTDPGVRYYTHGRLGTVLVMADAALVYRLAGSTSASTLTESPVGAPTPRVEGGRRAATAVNIFKGKDPAGWQRNLQTYETVRVGQAAPGIELTLRASAEGVEKIFTVAPNENPDAIRMRMTGARSLSVADNGELIAATSLGDVRFSRPVAFQETARARQLVEVAYVVDGNEYGFDVGRYDRSRPLTIDPAIVSTFFGGSGDLETVRDILHDGNGHLYVAGMTNSPDLPGIGPGAPDSQVDGCLLTEAFVAKLDASLTGPVLSVTFLGGEGGVLEAATSLALRQGDVYVAGITMANDFPGITPASFDSTFAGVQEGFIVRLDQDLSSILAATYLGGSGDVDQVLDLAHDPITDNVYTAGRTTSLDFPFVNCTMDCVNDVGPGDREEGFIVALDASLSASIAGSYVGGSEEALFQQYNEESANAIVLGPDGSVFVGGVTNSPDFPFTMTGAQTSHGGFWEGYILKFAPGFTALVAGSFYGNPFRSADIKSLARFNTATGYWIFAAGHSQGSQSSSLPEIYPGSADPATSGALEGFVVRFDSDLSAIGAATFLGGTSSEYIDSIVAPPGPGGTVFVAGTTWSADFPGIDGESADGNGGAKQSFHLTEGEMFVARIDASLSTIFGATYFGDKGGEWGNALALDSSAGDDSDVWVAGGSRSGILPGLSPSSTDHSVGEDQSEGAIARLGESLEHGWVINWNLVKHLLQLLGRSEEMRGAPGHLDLVRAHGRRRNWDAAIDAAQQFIDSIDRLVRAGVIGRDDGRRLSEMTAQMIAELEVARREGEIDRVPPRGPRREPPLDLLPSCPAAPPRPPRG